MGKTNKSAGGVGESKNFGVADADRTFKTAEDRMLACHIDGKPVAEMNLPPQVLSALDYFATDEGVAEKNARPDVREPSGIVMGTDDFGKALLQRRDEVKERNMPIGMARDPLKEVADKYAVPGMRPKFMSRARIKEEGGTGMHEVVLKPNGDPVMVKGMVLGHAPEKDVEARIKRFAGRGNQLLNQIGEKHKQENGGKAELVDPR